MDFYDFDYRYDYGSSMDSMAVTILMVYLGIFLIWGLFSLVSYIIKAIGIYTIAKREGAEYPWLAFVPFARTYLQGELGGEIVLKKKSIHNPGIWLLVLPFVEGAAVFVMYLAMFGIIGFSAFSSASGYYGSGISAGTVGMLILLLIVFVIVLVALGAGLQVLRILVNHQILGKFTSQNMSIVHAVLMGIIPLYESICFLIMSRKPYNPGMEPPEVKPFIQMPPQAANPYMGTEPPVMPEAPVQTQNEWEQRREEPMDQKSEVVPQRGLMNAVPPEIQKAEKAEDDARGRQTEASDSAELQGEETKTDDHE